MGGKACIRLIIFACSLAILFHFVSEKRQQSMHGFQFFVYIRPEGGFTLKTHQMFSIQTTPEEFKHGRFNSEIASNVFRSHYTGGI